MYIDEVAAVKHLVHAAGLPKEVGVAAKATSTIESLNDLLVKKAAEKQKQHDAAVTNAETIADPQKKVIALDKAKSIAEPEAAKQLRNELNLILKQKPLSKHILDKYLSVHIPKFLYFDEYYQMEGQINIDALKQRQAAKQLVDSDHPMLGLIELANLNVDQLVDASNTQKLKNQLEGAGNYLSQQILRFWSQNKTSCFVSMFARHDPRTRQECRREQISGLKFTTPRTG